MEGRKKGERGMEERNKGNERQKHLPLKNKETKLRIKFNGYQRLI